MHVVSVDYCVSCISAFLFPCIYLNNPVAFKHQKMESSSSQMDVKPITSSEIMGSDEKSMEELLILSQSSVSESKIIANLTSNSEFEPMPLMSNGDKQNQQELPAFKCDLCLFKTSEESDFIKHQTVHEGLRCQQCDFIGYRQHNLVSHIEQVHKQSRFNCAWCTYTACRKTDLTKHIKSYHNGDLSGGGTEIIPLSSLSPLPPSSLSELVMKAPTQPILPLKLEEIIFPPLKEAKSERVMVEDSSFNSIADKPNHLDQLEGVKQEFFGHICPICSFQATTKTSFDNHLLAVHEIEEISNNSYDDEMSVDNDSGIWEAETDPLSGKNAKISMQISKEVEKKIITQVPAEVNAKIPTRINTPGSLHCTKCNFSTEYGKKDMKEHNRTAHNEYRFILEKHVILNCSRCNYTTRNGKQILQEHEDRIHDGVFHRCDICGKSYGRKTSVALHKMRVHQGIKKFKCAICEVPKFEKKQVIFHVRECHPEIYDMAKVEAVIIRIPGPLLSRKSIRRQGTTKKKVAIMDITPVQKGSLVNHLAPKEGFTYTLGAQTSGMVPKGQDSLTYLNKDQFYTLNLNYAHIKVQELKTEVVTSIITLQFREQKEREEVISAFEFWRSRLQETSKARLLEVDTKSSTGLVGDITEVAHNAVLVRWSPLISAVNLKIAIGCSSRDFSLDKGVKGVPLHIQIDTYEDLQSSNIVNDRAFCQIRTFCDKGAERKAREEGRKLSRQPQLANGFDLSEPRSVFQRDIDLVSEPIFFTPKAGPLPPKTLHSALTMKVKPTPISSGIPEPKNTYEGEAIKTDHKGPLNQQPEKHQYKNETENNSKATNSTIGGPHPTEFKASQRENINIKAMKSPPLALTGLQQPSKSAFRCIICLFLGNSKTNLSEHMISKHRAILEEGVKVPTASKVLTECHDVDNDDERISFYKCNMCDYESIWLSSLICHKKQSHQSFKCTQCIFMSSSESDMVFHWRLQHDTKRGNLKIIPVAPPSVGLKGQNVNTRKVSECIMCTFQTYSKESLSQHIIKEHKDMLEDEMEEQENDRMENQTAKIDSDDEKVGFYKCDMCDYASVWISHWSEHKKQSHESFKCHKCRFTSSSEVTLADHWQSYHKETNG